MNSNLGKQKFFLIYQISNLITGKIYVGAHVTYNINDKYFGSSKYLKKDVKELGKNNFRKEILHIFDNKEDMMNKEAEIVNKEFCHRIDTYNRMIGGINEYTTEGMITVKDKEGNYSLIYLNDPRYLSGELVSIGKGMVTVKDKDDKTFQINKSDERYLSGELVPFVKGKVTVKDKDGNHFYIDKNDERYLSGELVGYRTGLPQQKNAGFLNKKHKEETKIKQSEENEDRIVTNKPYIDNANNYIIEIHIFIIPEHNNKETISEITNLAAGYNLPVYFYLDEPCFRCRI